MRRMLNSKAFWLGVRDGSIIGLIVGCFWLFIFWVVLQ